MTDKIRVCRAPCNHNLNGYCTAKDGATINILAMCSTFSPKESRMLKGKSKE